MKKITVPSRSTHVLTSGAQRGHNRRNSVAILARVGHKDTNLQGGFLEVARELGREHDVVM